MKKLMMGMGIGLAMMMMTQTTPAQANTWITVRNQFCAIKTFYQNNTALNTSVSAVTGAVDAYGIALRTAIEYERARHTWEQSVTTLDGVLARIKFAFKGPLTAFGRIYPPFMDNTKKILKEAKVPTSITNQYNNYYSPLSKVTIPLNATNTALMAGGFAMCNKVMLFGTEVRRQAAIKLMNQYSSQMVAVLQRLTNLKSHLGGKTNVFNTMKGLSSIVSPIKTATSSLNGLGSVLGFISPLTNSLERELDRKHCIRLKVGGVGVKKCLRFKNQIDKLNKLGKFSKLFEKLLNRYIMNPIVKPITNQLQNAFNFGIGSQLGKFNGLSTSVATIQVGIPLTQLQADLQMLKNINQKLRVISTLQPPPSNPGIISPGQPIQPIQ